MDLKRFECFDFYPICHSFDELSEKFKTKDSKFIVCIGNP